MNISPVQMILPELTPQPKLANLREIEMADQLPPAIESVVLENASRSPWPINLLRALPTVAGPRIQM